MNETFRLDLERYLDGTMSPEEGAAFLAEVRKDEEALAFLGRALEDQAHLFDAIRAEAPARRRFDTTRRLGTRRPRASLRTSISGVGWTAGFVAAGLFVLLLAVTTSGGGSRPKAPTMPRDLAAAPVLPSPEPPPRLPPPKRSDPDPLPPLPPVPPPTPKGETPPRREEPSPEPPRRDPLPPRDVVKPSAVAIAELNRVQGDCFVIDGTGKVGARTGMTLLSGQGLETGLRGAAAVRFADSTHFELGAASILRECSQGPGGKRLSLDSGTLIAEVAKQLGGAPLVIATPQAEVFVLGTRFTVSCAPDSTRVEVREGRVRVVRLSDGASTEAAAESFAVVAAGIPLEAKPFPIDEILLIPAQGKIQGVDWRSVRDVDAATGLAFESLKAQKSALQDAPCVVFGVNAEAGKTYYVWVRGKCLAKTSRIEHDAVIVDFGNGEVTEPPGPNKGLMGSPARGLFNGFMHSPGYGWVGSDSDQGRDSPSVTVRFARPGRQTLRLYSLESPVRVDSIWLSATQKTRPDDGQTGPAPAKK